MNIQTNIVDKLTPEIIQDMQHIHFVADLHHAHPKIVDICNRPVSKEEHDEWLLKEVFNKYVDKKDEVYVLGDVSLYNRKEAQKFVARMNGNKHLIVGNHDKSVDHLGNWCEITQIKDFSYSRFGLNIHIVLCHFPMISWNRRIHGSWMLHGHTHGRNEYINEIEKYGLIYDVGIDNKEFFEYTYRPLNLYEVCLIMKKRENQINFKLNSL